MDAERLNELREMSKKTCNLQPELEECLNEIEAQQKEIERLKRWHTEAEVFIDKLVGFGQIRCRFCIIGTNPRACSAKYPNAGGCQDAITAELDKRAEVGGKIKVG